MSKVSCPLSSFLSTNVLMEGGRFRNLSRVKNVRFTKRSDLKKVFTLMVERMKNASIQVNVEKQIANVGLRLFS
jgi:hypothetical protein